MKKLSKSHERILRKEIARRSKNVSKFHKFENGWFSTSVKTPQHGMIFSNIENGEILPFTDKYRHEHIGIVSEVYFERHVNQLMICVVCYETNIIRTTLDFDNYGMLARHSNDPRIKAMMKDKNLMSKLNEYLK